MQCCIKLFSGEIEMSKMICFKFNPQSQMKDMHKTKNQSMNVSLFHISEHTNLND